MLTIAQVKWKSYPNLKTDPVCSPSAGDFHYQMEESRKKKKTIKKKQFKVFQLNIYSIKWFNNILFFSILETITYIFPWDNKYSLHRTVVMIIISNIAA